MTQQQPNCTEAAVLETEVRLRMPSRMQVQMVIRCINDLVPAAHRVRTVVAFVAKLDWSSFFKLINARKGHSGRDANHLPKARCVALWCALAYNVMNFAAKLIE